MKQRENIFFLILLITIFVFGLLSFTKTEAIVSKSENRNLATFPHLTIESFLDNSFQNTFENAISDQFVLSEQIRQSYSGLINSLPNIADENAICRSHYLELPNSVDRRRATFNCGDYIIYFPEPLDESQATIVANNITKYNHLNSITNTYYYFIDDSSVYDFENNTRVLDYQTLLNNNLLGHYHLSSLTFDSYEDYQKLFYKTDHHWDYRGSYQGYRDVVKLLDAGAPLEPTGIGTNHEYTFGSHARLIKHYDIEEEFDFYTFDLPSHSTAVNGEPNLYGHYQDYINHNYDYDRETNYYAYFYGPDEGEIIYDFYQPSKPNLLIVSNSYSNAVNELIASHFNKTYIIDLRRYQAVFGHGFEPTAYIANHQIDKTLLIMSPTFIREVETNQGLEY